MDPIREKLASGKLPREDWDRTRMVLGGPAASPCVACGEPTTPENLAVWCERGGHGVALHPDCYVLWDEARQDDAGR
jgi:hypothetical protein